MHFQRAYIEKRVNDIGGGSCSGAQREREEEENKVKALSVVMGAIEFAGTGWPCTNYAPPLQTQCTCHRLGPLYAHTLSLILHHRQQPSRNVQGNRIKYAHLPAGTTIVNFVAERNRIEPSPS